MPNLSPEETAELYRILDAALSILPDLVRMEVGKDVKAKDGHTKSANEISPGEDGYPEARKDLLREVGSQQAIFILLLLYQFQYLWDQDTRPASKSIGAKSIARVRSRLAITDQSALAKIIKAQTKKFSKTVMTYRLDCLARVGLIRRIGKRFVVLTDRGCALVAQAARDACARLMPAFAPVVEGAPARTWEIRNLNQKEVAEFYPVLFAACASLEELIGIEPLADTANTAFTKEVDLRQATSRQAVFILQFMYQVKYRWSKTPEALAELIGADEITVVGDLVLIDQSTLAKIIETLGKKLSATVMIGRLECLELFGLISRTPGNQRFVFITDRGCELVEQGGNNAYSLLEPVLAQIGENKDLGASGAEDEAP